jgi:ATP-dependent helicase/nuclease subunit A
MRPLAADGPQRRASNPGHSAWVAANAGSGKTQVLVHRVIRLLLEGTLPERILCITFTNAAAAEMSKRLFRDLGEWIALDDEALAQKIRSLTGDKLAQLSLARARRLFACALDAPGGLKIQTIHSFCERLLQRFPIEAGVVPGFRVLSEEQAAELLSAAARLLLTTQADESESECIRTVVRYAGAQQFDGLLKELLKKPQFVLQLAEASMRRQALDLALSLKPGTTPQTVAAAALASIDRQSYLRAADSLDALGNNAARLAQSIRAGLAEPSEERAFDHLRDMCLTKEGECRRYFPPAGLQKTDPAAARFLESELRRLEPLFNEYRASVMAKATDSLLHLGVQIIAAYERAKRALGTYDYDDLILKSLGLFSAPSHRSWVLYKLDSGIDHILIDEAQDTSPEQWQIVQNLTEDFFAGAGAREETVRTIFAVGDEKQSIFSFQGADPRYFRAMRDYFAGRIAASGAKLDKVPLTVSFRSTAAILDAVDAVFANEVHQPSRIGAEGLVEVWPLEEGEDQPQRDPWCAPVDHALADRPRRRLARRIARTIRQWIDEKELLPSRGRPIQPSDILILVRNRTNLMDELVRALKNEQLPVAGADRLELTSHIAVMDLIALGQFASLPEDDQMLACVLKSPLVERDDGCVIDEEDLFNLAHGRGASTLWQQLEKAVAMGLPYRNAFERLGRWRRDAEWKPSYEFFSTVLNECGGLARIVSRLGSEAVEPVGEFLSRCLDYDEEYAPSLTGLLSSLAAQSTVVKRDMDFGAGEIRVMTVHGAKGLESNIVILPDTCNVPDPSLHPKILFTPVEIAGRKLEVPLWRVKIDRDHDLIARLREEHQQRQLEEHNRLLYVAMTRAADRLYVCGSAGKDLAQQCWYSRIESGLKQKNIGSSCAGPDGRAVWRYCPSRQAMEGGQPSMLAEDMPLPEPLPDWLKSKPAPEPASLPWLAPSKAAESLSVNRETIEKVRSPLNRPFESALERGSHIHRLLQSLPALPLDLREARAKAYLSLKAHRLTAEEQQEISATVLQLLTYRAFSSVFSPESLAEAPIVARVKLKDGRIVPVSGRIDRLIVKDDEVLILDFKSNRPPPDGPEDVDSSYVRQLALYRQAMLLLYPERAVRAGLLWTEGPRLMELPAILLDRSLDEGYSQARVTQGS